MKNPFAHIKPEAPLHLLRSLLFHFSPHVERHSVSNRYLGLCVYVNGISTHSEKKVRIIYEK
jgi:hypothetical protein